MKGLCWALYRVRVPLAYVVVVVLIGNAILGRFVVADELAPVRHWIVGASMALAVLCVILSFVAPRYLPLVPARSVHAPVDGRWLALNSPASAVPSHGVRAYGQAYAIDLVAEFSGSPRPEFGGAMMRARTEYPAWGAPVRAMIDGTVVRASQWRRDHRARSNGWGLIYLMFEGAVREIGGPGFVVGNHVVIRSDDGVYAAVAHLQQGSVSVSVGQRVRVGAIIGRCGNSGNSSEPHVHAQLMDRASFWTAQGLPMAFERVTVDDGSEPIDGLPANGQHLRA